MKKIITLLFCIGLFTASFAQPGGKRARGNNQGNQDTESYGNNQYNNNGGNNSHTSGNYGTYKRGTQSSNSYDEGMKNNYRHDRNYSYQRGSYGDRYRDEGYQNRSYNDRRNYDECENRYSRHRGFPAFIRIHR